MNQFTAVSFNPLEKRMYLVNQIILPDNNPDANPVELRVAKFAEFWEADCLCDSIRNKGGRTAIYYERNESWVRMTPADISMACFYAEN